jgi:hypothetical protein
LISEGRLRAGVGGEVETCIQSVAARVFLFAECPEQGQKVDTEEVTLREIIESSPIRERPS